MHIVNLSTAEATNKLKIYQDYFEKTYIAAARDFYKTHAPVYLAENGVQNYMKYVGLNDRATLEKGNKRGEGGRILKFGACRDAAGFLCRQTRSFMMRNAELRSTLRHAEGAPLSNRWAAIRATFARGRTPVLVTRSHNMHHCALITPCTHLHSSLYTLHSSALITIHPALITTHQLRDTCTEVLVKDRSRAIADECPSLIAANAVESK